MRRGAYQVKARANIKQGLRQPFETQPAIVTGSFPVVPMMLRRCSKSFALSHGKEPSLSLANDSCRRAIHTAPHLDFRSFIEALREDGDLADIHEEVDSNLEVAAIVRRGYEQRAKAPLFHNVRGARNGLFRIMGAQGGLSQSPKTEFGRLARHVGLPPTARPRDIENKMLAAKSAKPLPPIHVDTGPCKEIKIPGDLIDLTKLPVPLLNKSDGGKYIQTMGINIVPHPTEVWVNWSIARAMIHDKNRMAGLIMKPQHIARIFSEWVKRGEDMPYAIALGAPPIAVMAASMPIPAGITEAEYVGSICGSALELVKCETNDLYVPANSEIVLEGTVSVKDKAKEGPFGEMHGYSFLDEGNLHQPLYTVKAITHRKDAILPICVPGRATGVDETHTMIGTLAAAEIRQLLQDNSFPVKEVFTPYESQVIWAAIQVDRAELAKLKTNAKDFCEKVGNLVFRNKAGMQIHRLLVVGDDIDPYDFRDVTWAFATRCRPAEDEFHFEDVAAYPLVPYMSHGSGTKLTGGKVVANCLLPMEYEGRHEWAVCDFQNGYPEDVKKRVLDRWETFSLNTAV